MTICLFLLFKCSIHIEFSNFASLPFSNIRFFHIFCIYWHDVLGIQMKFLENIISNSTDDFFACFKISVNNIMIFRNKEDCKIFLWFSMRNNPAGNAARWFNTVHHFDCILNVLAEIVDTIDDNDILFTPCENKNILIDISSISSLEKSIFGKGICICLIIVIIALCDGSSSDFNITDFPFFLNVALLRNPNFNAPQWFSTRNKSVTVWNGIWWQISVICNTGRGFCHTKCRYYTIWWKAVFFKIFQKQV